MYLHRLSFHFCVITAFVAWALTRIMTATSRSSMRCTKPHPLNLSASSLFTASMAAASATGPQLSLLLLRAIDVNQLQSLPKPYVPKCLWPGPYTMRQVFGGTRSWFRSMVTAKTISSPVYLKFAHGAHFKCRLQVSTELLCALVPSYMH